MILEHVRFRVGIPTTSRIARLVGSLKKRVNLQVRHPWQIAQQPYFLVDRRAVGTHLAVRRHYPLEAADVGWIVQYDFWALF